jgi:hypothetical protein
VHVCYEQSCKQTQHIQCTSLSQHACEGSLPVLQLTV